MVFMKTSDRTHENWIQVLLSRDGQRVAGQYLAFGIGMVIYLQDGPQFRHMGIASNRLYLLPAICACP